MPADHSPEPRINDLIIAALSTVLLYASLVVAVAIVAPMVLRAGRLEPYGWRRTVPDLLGVTIARLRLDLA